MTAPRLMSGAEAAAYCGVTSATFSKWVASGIVPKPVQFTRRWDRKALSIAVDRIDVRPAFPTMSQVYFIGSKSLVKVGFSGDARVRLKALRAASPVELELLYAIPGSEPEEKRIHIIFNHLRQHGEWFTAATELLAYVEWLKARR